MQNFPTPANSDKNQQRVQRQQHLLDSYRHKETWMKWTIATSALAIVVLLSLLGFATDWTRGLHKDKTATTPISSNLDSLHTASDGVAPATTSDSTNGSNNSTTAGTDTTHTNASSDRSSTTSNTTTNNSTTTNNTSTTTDPAAPSDGLLQKLYDDTSAG